MTENPTRSCLTHCGTMYTQAEAANSIDNAGVPWPGVVEGLDFPNSCQVNVGMAPITPETEPVHLDVGGVPFGGMILVELRRRGDNLQTALCVQNRYILMPNPMSNPMPNSMPADV